MNLTEQELQTLKDAKTEDEWNYAVDLLRNAEMVNTRLIGG